MKLFKISQSERCGYDTHDSAIVAAEDEDDAASIHPGYGKWDDKYGSWASSPAKVCVEYLGEATDGIERGVIIASFNAG